MLLSFFNQNNALELFYQDVFWGPSPAINVRPAPAHPLSLILY